MRNKDIVVIGIQPWDTEIGSNCKDIASEFAKSNRVLYVNIPISRLSAIKDKNVPSVKKRLDVINGKAKAISEISHNLWEYNPPILIEPINKIKNNAIFDFFNKRNSKKFAAAVKQATDELGFKNFILFNDSSMFLGYYINEFLEYDLNIYYIRDNLVKSRDAYWHTQGPRIEKGTIEKADLTVTNSIYYANYAKQFTPNSFMVGQGCDTSLFDDTVRNIETAKDLSSIQQPIIGYVGFLTTKRLDIETIELIAKGNSNWQIVLVGPEDEDFKKSNLHSISNIHFLGSRAPETLPEYIKGFDICINPQIINHITIGNYPRKVDEYLAMGKPVIATKTEAMEYFAEHTYLANSPEEYVNLIEKALAEDNQERKDARRFFAKSHSWEENVNQIWEAVKKVKNN